ncbi:MAG: DUF1254 domain-containing protein [Erythrobacter sp.]|jgi:uncharacterized membrane protein|nr:DUF1254 domain-containing protein [Erythrobacter sp.]
MRAWLGPLAVFLVSALAAHGATLALAPRFIMNRTMDALEQRGVALHAFTTPLRISPQTQTVVRSSPDLFYSLCRFDLAEPEDVLRVTMSEWPDYQSVSFYDAQTNNFLTYRGSGERIAVSIAAPDARDPRTIASPTRRGVVLLRRLAPTQAAFERAARAARADRCELTRRED